MLEKERRNTLLIEMLIDFLHEVMLKMQIRYGMYFSGTTGTSVFSWEINEFFRICCHNAQIFNVVCCMTGQITSVFTFAFTHLANYQNNFLIHLLSPFYTDCQKKMLFYFIFCSLQMFFLLIVEFSVTYIYRHLFIILEIM